MFTPEEKKQYNRHLILDEIGADGQENLKASKVLVIGAGGLGCPILQYLTAAGVGTIGIIDDDIVDQSNLQRQILYTHDDIGKPKASVATTRLSKLNPYIHFDVYVEKLSRKRAIEIFKKYDIIIDGSDNFPTRYLANDAAILANKPLVFGAIFKFEGQVSVFNYQGGPTYRCLYPTSPVPGEVPNCSDIGVLGVLPGIIGSLQANEVIKMICGIGDVLSGKLLTYDTLSHKQLILKFDKTENAIISKLEDSYEDFCGIVRITDISLEHIKKQPESYQLLDVREDWEREEFHIGGQHIPLAELPYRFQEINTSKEIVVYCKTGERSKTAVALLEKLLPKERVLRLKDML